MYKQPEPLDGLPNVPFEWIQEDLSLPFPNFEHDRLVGSLNATHATDLKTWRSVTGYLLILCGAAIAWKVISNLLLPPAWPRLSSAKAAKYFRCVLEELAASRKGVTLFYINNEAAIVMINENHPTTHARHIKIQHSAIQDMQEWQAKKELVMRHIPGIINPSNDLHLRSLLSESAASSTWLMVIEVSPSALSLRTRAAKILATTDPSCLTPRSKYIAIWYHWFCSHLGIKDGNGFVKTSHQIASLFA